MNQKVINDFKNWLGSDGMSFFKELKEKYGTVLEMGQRRCNRKDSDFWMEE